MNKKKSAFDVKTLVTLGMLTALAYAVMAACKVIPKVEGFLSLDVTDAVIGIGGFLFGPLAVVCMSVVESLIEMVTVSTTGWYGLFMNIISTVFFLVPAVYLYRRSHKTSGAVLGLGVGVACRTMGMVAWNYIVTPRYFGMAQEGVVALMPIIIIFNLVKGILNAALIMMLYPPVASTLRRAGLVAPSTAHGTGEKPKFNYVPLLVSAVVLVTAILAVVVMLRE